MNASKLATPLTITFVVSVVFLFAELLFLLRRRRGFRPHSSQPPISGDDKSHAKELLHFFRLKSETRVEPSGAPIGNPESDDPVIDVFKLLEANGPSRVLCTIKEDDREEVETTSISGVEIPASEKVSLQMCLDVEAEGTKTVLNSPCDSPMFFTPMGSPAGNGVCSEFVSPVSNAGGPQVNDTFGG
ncbi:hypothetical protein R6Q59_024498 [Mikania micrantha]|uniref:Uncharacterized protein n=1 Tax=Mikania micrantha TaxID=192012 RepID=A0A5N6P381_9ASTR|nr:hypothetical protein E3N88_14607 [Mikania micrantha]